MSTVDEYLNNVSPLQRKELEKIRQLVKQIVPEAEEVISYGVPTFKYKKRPLIYYAAFTNHMSIFPASDEMIKVIEELAKYRTSKGTLQFTETNPIPELIIKKIIKFRLTDISKT